MSRTHSSRWLRERRQSRTLMMVFALVLLTGVVLQIAMMAHLSGQSKRVAEVEWEIENLEARTRNLNMSLNQYHNLDRITVRAKQLGMAQPDETQLRVVNLPALVDSTTTQSADGSGAEEMMD